MKKGKRDLPSNEKFRILVELATDWLWEVNEHAVYTYSNPKVKDILGYEPEEILGKTPFDLMPPEEAQRVGGIFQEIAASRRPFSLLENVNIHKSGRPVILETSGIPFFDAEGHFMGYHGIDRDITGRKRMEDAIRVEHGRFQAIMGAMVDGLYIANQRYGVEYVNPVIERQFGPVKGRRCYEYLHDRAKPCDWCKNKEIFSGETVRSEWLSSKTKRLYITLSSPLKNPDGSVSKFEIFHDITDRVKAEQTLRESEEKYRFLVETMNEGFSILDKEGKITYANKKMCEMAGYSREEMIGSHVSRFFDDANMKIVREQLEKRKGIDLPYEIAWTRKDGQKIHTILSPRPLFDAEGSFQGSFAVATDLTERKRMEEQMKAQQERLFHANKLASLGTLTAGVAHEINNPNNFMSFSASMLEKFWSDALPVLDAYFKERGSFSLGGLPYEEAREDISKLIARVREGAERIKGIVEGLKNFARKGIPEKPVLFSIGSILDSAVALLGPQLKKFAPNFSVRMEPDLPMIRGNPREIEQVLVNLFLNASQALSSPEKKVWVEVSCPPPAKRIVVKIGDEGAGIDPENLRRIGDPFFTTKHQEGMGMGMGMGLYISQIIIANHGGTLSFESEAGKGTVATMILPVAE